MRKLFILTFVSLCLLLTVSCTTQSPSTIEADGNTALIESLTNELARKDNQIVDLQQQVKGKDTTIAVLKEQIQELQTEVEPTPVPETPSPAPAPAPAPAPTPEPMPPIGLSRDNPVPMGQSLLTDDGIEITVLNFAKGNQAWEVILEANRFNDPPSADMQYVIIVVKVVNISSKDEPERVGTDFDLVGSSNRVFSGTERSVVLPGEGEFKSFEGFMGVELYHGGEDTGALDFYIPENESDLVLIYDKFSLFGDNKLFFEVR